MPPEQIYAVASHDRGPLERGCEYYPPSPPVVRVAAGAVATAVLLVVWWSWLRFGHSPQATRRAVSDLGFVLAPGVAGWRGWRVAQRAPEVARAWRWLAIGCLTWAAASAVWAVYALLGQFAPFPSFADVGYIGYAIPVVLGLLALPRVRRLRTSRLRSDLDAALIVCSLLFLSWTLVLGEISAAPLAHEWYRLDALAYPIVDAVLVALVLTLGARYAVGRQLSWVLLMVGLVTLAVTDSTYAVASVDGTYTAGTGFDLRWAGAFLLIALAADAASVPQVPSRATDRITDLLEEAVPYLPLGIATVVAAVTRLTPTDRPVSFGLGCVLFSVAAGRQAVLAYEHRRLTDSLDRQVLDRTRALSDSETRMRALLANLSDAVLIVDPSTDERRLSYASPALYTLLGVPPDELTCSAQLLARLHPDDVSLTARRVKGLDQGLGPHRWQVRLGHTDGSWRTVEVTGTNLTADPAVAGNVLVLHDVTERERLQQELRFVATHDSLTGLGNRRGLFERLVGTLASADRRGERTALVLLDLDGFKAVNDTLGHAAGDELLLLAGQRLTACAREGDYVCRLGGDEFAVVLEPTSGDGDDVSDAWGVSERLIDVLREPFVLPGANVQPVALSASGGIAVRQPFGPQDAGELLREADLAMYAVKAHGRDGLQTFDWTMRDTTFTRLALHDQLRRALGEHEFVVHYQPVFEVGTGRMHGLEALVRWQHPDRGLLAPGEFIAAAEDSGLIVAMGSQVLATACAQLRDWHNAGAPDLTMSVNVSPRELTAHLTGQVVAVLREHQVNPASLILEITESLLTDDLPPCLLELSNLGVRLSVDDFGTGYSSLSRLRGFPVHELKIDRSFVEGIGADDRSAALAGSIIDLAHALDLTVVAEGVETPAQLAFLREHDCELAQGFLLGRPVTAETISELLAGHLLPAPDNLASTLPTAEPFAVRA